VLARKTRLHNGGAFDQEMQKQGTTPVAVNALSPQSESGTPPVGDPNMQTVVIAGKRLSAQEQEDYDKYAMRMSTLQALAGSRPNRSAVKRPRQARVQRFGPMRSS
jgi:hypothetical protein